MEAEMAVELHRWIIEELPKPDEVKRFDGIYKIVAMGEPDSGMTEILDTIVTGRFDRDYRRTLGIDISTYDVKLKNYLFKLLIWDLLGQGIFRDLPARFCQGASGGLLFFDCTRQKTLEPVPSWVESFRETVGPKPHLYLIGTKADLTKERKVQPKEAEKLVEELAVNRYYEISTVHQEFIGDIINTMALQAYQHHMVKRRVKGKGRAVNEEKSLIEKITTCPICGFPIHPVKGERCPNCKGIF